MIHSHELYSRLDSGDLITGASFVRGQSNLPENAGAAHDIAQCRREGRSPATKTTPLEALEALQNTCNWMIKKVEDGCATVHDARRLRHDSFDTNFLIQSDESRLARA